MNKVYVYNFAILRRVLFFIKIRQHIRNCISWHASWHALRFFLFYYLFFGIFVVVLPSNVHSRSLVTTCDFLLMAGLLSSLSISGVVSITAKENVVLFIIVVTRWTSEDNEIKKKVPVTATQFVQISFIGISKVLIISLGYFGNISSTSGRY